ncbi:translocon at the outer envelope membrane of chloroplasts 159 [Rhynchospora pubera]|uniref:Translocon at the outer envelope membrane of chloroplasts 159 n=1 Tax=Rhynchospora pubera TaxID=906938 RepID=A0AAV8FWQ6_9POAL|nr:translocon at the outer envelope membrane of chloroplasts 159 [Rhynchospora pubera]
MASTGPVPLTTARGPLPIRARLSMHDDTDSDISPAHSDMSGDSDDSASEQGEETMTMASGATGLETASGKSGFGRGLSMPVAKITGDDEYESLGEEEVERDWSLGVAKVISPEKELNLVENESEDGFFEATDVAGKETFQNVDESSNDLRAALASDGLTVEPLSIGSSQGNTDGDVTIWTKTRVQDVKLEPEVATQNLEVRSYSLDGERYDKNDGNTVYDVANSNKNSVSVDASEHKEAIFEPHSDTVGGGHSVDSLEDVNNIEVGKNTSFNIEDADHIWVEGTKDVETRQYKLSKDRGKGKVMADGFHFDDATDDESSITTVNLDEENLNESEEEDDTIEFDPAALAAMIRQATGAPADATIAITSAPDGTRLFSIDQALPADTGPLPSSPHTVHLERKQADASPSSSDDDFVNLLTEEGKKVHEKVHSVRMEFIRMVNRLGLSIEENKTASEVLGRLTIAEGLKLKIWLDNAKILEKAKEEALCLDAEGKDLNFSCTILVLGKRGVGKSALINSIFKNEVCRTHAFDTGTDRIKEIVGVVDGVTLRVVDTPGLSTSVMVQGANRKLLSSIKMHVKKHPPDVVLYVDRVDLQTKNFNDIPILASITETLGRTVWQKVVRALTHAGSTPPEGRSGAQLDYETYIAQQVHATQRTLHMATQDTTLSNPVALVENHASCRTNQGGEQVLPNGIAWRPNLLLLCYSVKIMSEVYSVLNPGNHNLSNAGFGLGMLRLPLQFFLSSLLRSRPHLKLTGGVVDSDNDSDELSDSDLEREEDEYDALPPFKPLMKSEIEKLSKKQKRVYFEEYAYRIKLFENKQRKEAVRRSKEMKRNRSDGLGTVEDVDYLAKEGPAESTHITELTLPLSFDGDCPLYRFRSLQNSNSWVQVRAVSDAQGWDHDCGLNGVIVDHNPVIRGQFPASTWLQLKKNKEEFTIHLDSSICARHGEAGSTLTSLEVQKFGNGTAYILHGETRLKNLARNSITGGMSISFSGDTVATGLKIQNRARICKPVTVTSTAGMVHAKNNTIYGCDLEAQIGCVNYLVGQSQSSIGLNLVKLKDVLSIGASFKTDFEVSPSSKLSVNLGVDSKRTGQLSISVKSTEQTQIAILGLISLGLAIFNRFCTNGSNASEGSKILH